MNSSDWRSHKAAGEDTPVPCFNGWRRRTPDCLPFRSTFCSWTANKEIVQDGAHFIQCSACWMTRSQGMEETPSTARQTSTSVRHEPGSHFLSNARSLQSSLDHDVMIPSPLHFNQTSCLDVFFSPLGWRSERASTILSRYYQTP